jgi:hypothetical protein
MLEKNKKKTMKRMMKLGMLTLTIALFSVSCNELLDKLNITFEIGPQDIYFTFEPKDSGATVTSYDVVFHDMEQEVEDNGGSMDQLDLVKLKSASIAIVSGAVNFNDFESFEVFIKTPTKTQKKIAEMVSVPLNATVITPDVISDNLKEYMLEGEYTVILQGILREDVTETISLVATIYFDVNL